ncbi:MAG: peptidase gingipain [Solirubrobacterales bacterium]|nr:peptidase gingipain [Solirubrobacterales bacterium]
MSVVLLTAAGASPAAAAAPPKTQAAALRSLVTQTRAVPRAVTTKSQRRNLLRFATHARRAAIARPCVAVADLARYRRILRFVKVKPLKARRVANRRLAALGPASLAASRRLLASKKTKACGGGVVASTLPAARTTVLSSDENGMSIRVKLPALNFSPQTGGGKSWTQLTLPDTDAPAPPGEPAIPVVSSTFGVPDGATLTVIPGSTEAYTIDGVDVYPRQPESVDQDPSNPPKPDFLKGPFAARPFTVDDVAYATPGLVPAAPAKGEILGTARDIVVGGLQVPAAQYDAAKRTLKVLNTVDVKVTFDGGPKTFTDELNSPWERAQQRLIASLLNAAALKSKFAFPPRRCGEEMLVITNPATRAAADQLAVAKRAQGWRANVFQTGAGAGQIGTTPTAIQTFIRGRLTAPLCIHPSYVTIMGDDDLVPTFPGINGIPSDLQYSMKTDADELPDVAVGRIIGNDQAAVARAVTKIVAYETTAPTGNGMLGKALIAAQFQDDDNDGQENRTFIQFAEKVRNGLVRRGVAVDRIYGESPGNNPQRFNDGTALPAALTKPTFAWNGTGAQVSAGWNQGRFMVIHRDHGWSDGWGTPGYGTADVNALTNGSLLPVVLSVNCSSGAYDYDETSFAGESLVKADGGSVGVFGDTRDSPSWHNTQIALGFVDAMLPSILPGEGPPTKQRTGDALINGKLRLAGLAPPSRPGIAGGDGSTRNELYLWHYFGDPSMQMWGGGNPPIVFDPAVFTAVYKSLPPVPGDPAPYEVNVTLPAALAGQPISLLRNGQVIGKAFAGAGVATIPASFGDGSVKPGELEVAFEGDGAQPVKFPVKGVPEPQPEPAKPADLVVSALTASSLTIKNQGAGPAGAFKATIADSQEQVLTLSFDGLAAGASATQTYDCQSLGPQRHATADSAAQVTESDETNNATAPAAFTCNTSTGTLGAKPTIPDPAVQPIG